MEKLNWGIIGCGDVTEVKSGPAFNKVEHSYLLAVMRRDEEKAADYAKRHCIDRYYTVANELIQDQEVQAVYIATPPASHEEYAVASLAAGKPVYVEKPMALNAEGARRMLSASQKSGTKLTVAHYRRFQPKYLYIKQSLEEQKIGQVLFVNLRFFQPLAPQLVAQSETNWRLDPEISGGGLFHDLAPHQLDLLIYFFGYPKSVKGNALNQRKINAVDDLVAGTLIFEQDILFNGLWSFGVDKRDTVDVIEIYGSKGKITFSAFGYDFKMNVEGESTEITFDNIPHVEQAMIEEVNRYFRGERLENPCSAEDAIEVMKIMDVFTSK
ncbi:Gfo/Idh/MocA family protein [Pedobacter sp. AW1-32]|uniref:Gfo/Idh/MocA family protein n=1 Tax=Pedobacter sp. AW1-32 TaxID=3383026 RepID=UPI003FEDDD1C